MSIRNDIVLVSDFHLGTCGTAGDGRPVACADDSAFVSFLDDLQARAAREERGQRLLLLGDIFDFPHVPLASGRSLESALDTSDAAARAKLGWIRDRHPEFFRALARFAAAGLAVDIIPGNHDIQLLRRPVQEELRWLVADCGAKALPASWIRFHPWIYYEPGLVYAEHGQQYHYINTFSRLLAPALEGDDGSVVLPIGSYLDVRHARVSGRQSDLARKLLTAGLRMVSLSEGARRRGYQRRVLPSYAADLGLEYEAVLAIDDLARPTLPRLAGYLLKLIRKNAKGGRVVSRHLRMRAADIHGLLGARGAATPFYVFGHTHEAVLASLGHDGAGPWYINTGNWATNSQADAQGSPVGTFCPFVEIAVDGASGVRSARLLSWRGAAGGRELIAEASIGTDGIVRRKMR